MPHRLANELATELHPYTSLCHIFFTWYFFQFGRIYYKYWVIFLILGKLEFCPFLEILMRIWNFADLFKLWRIFEAGVKIWNLGEFLTFGWIFEICVKFWNLGDFFKSGRIFKIWNMGESLKIGGGGGGGRGANGQDQKMLLNSIYLFFNKLASSIYMSKRWYNKAVTTDHA